MGRRTWDGERRCGPRQALGHREQSLLRGLEWARSNEGGSDHTIALDCNQEGFLASCTESSSTGTEKFLGRHVKAVLLIFSWKSFLPAAEQTLGAPQDLKPLHLYCPLQLKPGASLPRPHSSSRARSRKYASSNSRVRHLLLPLFSVTLKARKHLHRLQS